MEIIIAKLITGEIIIGNRTDDDIKSCISLRTIQKSPTQVETHLAPLLHPFSDDFLNIEFDKVVYFSKANKNFIDQYNRVTSPILITPSIDVSKLKQTNITDFVPRRK